MPISTTSIVTLKPTWFRIGTGTLSSSHDVGCISLAGVRLIVEAETREVMGANCQSKVAKLLRTKSVFLEWEELEWNQARLLRATSVQSDSGNYLDVKRQVGTYSVSLKVHLSGSTYKTLTGTIWYDPATAIPCTVAEVGAHRHRAEFRADIENSQRLLTIS